MNDGPPCWCFGIRRFGYSFSFPDQCFVTIEEAVASAHDQAKQKGTRISVCHVGADVYVAL